MNTLRLLRSLVKPLAYAHRLIIVPLAAFLPAPLAYWLARLRGDWHYRRDCVGREMIMRNLAGVLGERLSPTERAYVTRDYFRLRSCEPVDVVRLAGKGRGLARLVEIRGREHLEAALAQGKGAILCGAHFGSFDASAPLIGIAGFPTTAVGRWTEISDPTLPPWVRRFRQWIQERCVVSHLRRPLIQPHPGQWKTAVQIATILRANEVIAMTIDPPSLAADRPRAVPIPFLGGQAMLLPGCVTIARLTGAPVLMLFLRRSADWRHQVLEISPQIPMDGDVVTAFARCAAAVEAAILRDPAHWIYWPRSDDLVDLGLLFATDETDTATPLAEVQVASERGFSTSL
jgi:KDO2-lipid IV(A) lauroyltransferase